MISPPSGIKGSHHFRRHVWLSSGLLVLLAATFAVYAWSEKRIDRANEVRQQSTLLANELRQSSDELTAMARMYAVTGNPQYKAYFQNILDVRDGRAPRLVRYQSVYLDLLLANSKAAVEARAPATPLLELMRRAGFTVAEFGKLSEAKASSDALARTEREAMRIVENGGPSSAEARDRAIGMLFDSSYLATKAGIMLPIDEFDQMVSRRTLDAVESAERRATILRGIFVAFGLVLMYMLWRTHAILQATLGGSVQQVYARIEALGKGDFTSDQPLAEGVRSNILGWLEETRNRLREVDGERRNAEERVQNMNAQLELRVQERTQELAAMTKELESFNYSVAHDLRAPLRIVDGYARLLQTNTEQILDEENRGFLQQIVRAATNMDQLIVDLLAYSRLQYSEAMIGRVDLKLLVDSLLAQYANDISAQGTEVTVHVNCPVVIADTEGVTMALRNLVGNAVKFSHKSMPPRIEIRGRDAGTSCVLSVRDNGVGFDMKYHDKIFGIFYRLHRNDDFPGTGVGLAIARKAMERMGGRLWADSAPGEGATFYLEIPHAAPRSLDLAED